VPKIFSLLMAALVVLLLSGCSASQGEDFDTKEKPRISVFLRPDVTQPQRDAVEAAIRAQPGIDTVTFESPEQAYANYKSLTEGSSAFDPSIKPETFPSSVRFTTKDLAAYDKIRKSSFSADLEKMPGMSRVVIQCATLAECQATLTPPPART
jgi:cell division protein FtsX